MDLKFIQAQAKKNKRVKKNEKRKKKKENEKGMEDVEKAKQISQMKGKNRDFKMSFFLYWGREREI